MHRSKPKRTDRAQLLFRPPVSDKKVKQKKALIELKSAQYKNDIASVKKLLRVEEIKKHLESISDMIKEVSIKPHR